MNSVGEHLKRIIQILQSFFVSAKAKLNRSAGRHLYRVSAIRGSCLRLHYLRVFQANHYEDFAMIYSLLHKEYFIEIWLRPLTQFIIISGSSRILLDEYPKLKDKSEILVNYIEDPNDQRLRIAGSFLVKNTRTCSELILSSSCKSVPKVEGRNEDAYFYTDLNIGIADGVGGVFIDFGISSQEFSIELMEKCKKISRNFNSSRQGKEIVKEALDSMISGGSSTFLLASLARNRLFISNFGDSRLMLFRKYYDTLRLVFQTTAKQHSFNIPFQVSKQFSPRQLQKFHSFSKENIKNSYENIDPDEYFTTVREGDILVIGTDGLFDNLFPSEIRKIIKKFPIESNLSETVDLLVEKALTKAKGKEYTPFEENMKNIQCEWKGGKMDDVTVIVSVVQKGSYL